MYCVGRTKHAAGDPVSECVPDPRPLIDDGLPNSLALSRCAVSLHVDELTLRGVGADAADRVLELLNDSILQYAAYTTSRSSKVSMVSLERIRFWYADLDNIITHCSAFLVGF